MDAEQSIAEIELLERIFSVPDMRPLAQAISRLRIGGTMRSKPTSASCQGFRSRVRVHSDWPL